MTTTPTATTTHATVVLTLAHLAQIYATNSNALLAAGTHTADSEATYVKMVSQLLALGEK